MEYIIYGLLVGVVFLIGLLVSQVKATNKVTKQKDYLVDYYKGQISDHERAWKVACERNDVLARKNGNLIHEIEQYKLREKRNLSIGYTSDELKKRLRFLLPDNKIAKNTRVNFKDGKIKAVVRKKVEGKYTDVEVEPTITYTT